MLNGSGIFFDDNTYYPHWYKNFFNKTIPLFGPYAWRADDFYGTRRMSSYFEYIIVSFFCFVLCVKIHLIGKMNGLTKQFKKKISVLVVIITIHHDIIMLVNGIVNGYLIENKVKCSMNE